MRFLTSRSVGMGCAVLGLAGAALVGAAPAARAQNSVTFNLSPSVPFSTTEINQLFATNKFDSSLGTLVGIQFNLTTGIRTTLTVQNNAATSSNGNVRTEVDVTLVDPNSLFPLDNTSPPQGTDGVNLFSYLSPRFNYTLAPGATATSGLLTSSSTATGDINNATVPNSSAIFAEFTGNAGDTINVTGRTKTNTVLSNNGGNTASSQVTQASISGTVTYFYTPEPGTISLLGSGLLVGGAGFGGQLRRRRIAKNQA